MRLFEFLECFSFETKVVIRENMDVLYLGEISDIPHRVCYCREIIPGGASADERRLVIETKRM